MILSSVVCVQRKVVICNFYAGKSQYFCLLSSTVGTGDIQTG